MLGSTLCLVSTTTVSFSNFGVCGQGDKVVFSVILGSVIVFSALVQLRRAIVIKVY